MSRSTRRRAAALAVACAAFASLTSTAGAASAVHFTPESYRDFQRQLTGGKIHAATFNKKAHTVHVTLNDRRHVLASYPSHDEPQLAARLEAKGASVKVMKHKGKAAVHHKLRYIAGAVLVVLILAILVVLLIGRRRSLLRAGADSPARSGPPRGGAGDLAG